MTLDNIKKFYKEAYKLSKIEGNIKENFKIASEVIDTLSEENLAQLFPEKFLIVDGRLVDSVVAVSFVPKNNNRETVVISTSTYFKNNSVKVTTSSWPSELIEDNFILCSVSTVFINFMKRTASFIVSTDMRGVAGDLFRKLFNGNIKILNETDYMNEQDSNRGSMLEISVDFDELMEE